MLARREYIITGLGFPIGLSLVFAVYCQLHSAFGPAPLPPEISLRWGLWAGAPAGLLCWFMFAGRRSLQRLLTAGLAHALLLGAALAALIAIGGAALHMGPELSWRSGVSAELIADAYARLPLAAALSALGVLLLWRTRPRIAAEPMRVQPDTGLVELPGRPPLVVRTRDIDHIRSVGNYCEVSHRGAMHLIRAPLQQMEDMLVGRGFVRIHRSLIVNVDRIATIEPAPRAGLTVRLVDGTRLPVGATYTHRVRDRFGHRTPAA